MNKFKISLIQPGFKVGPSEANTYFLPYSVGLLWSYAKTKTYVNNNFELNQLVWKHEPFDELIEKIKNDHIVAFSAYIWNNNYIINISKKLKKINPNILLVYGGPSIIHRDKNIFKKYPFMDLVVREEGEFAFAQILKEYLNTPPNWKTISNTIVNIDGIVFDNEKTDRIQTIDDIPSPYLSGVFTNIINENPSVSWAVLIASYRGCPYHCTFCDQGKSLYNKIRTFNINRVLDEIRWVGKTAGCEVLKLIDSNFGLFVENDKKIIKCLYETHIKYKSPNVYLATWAKNQNADTMLDIIKPLQNTILDSDSIGISVQTLNDDVLSIVKRNNMKINNIKEVSHQYAQHNIPIYTELILGLPGETLETWKQTYYDLFDADIHMGIFQYQAILLENTEMSYLQQKLYDIKTSRIYDFIPNEMVYSDKKDYEYVDVIKHTNTMPFKDMCEAYMFSWAMTTLHTMGVSTIIARFITKYKNITFRDFYDGLIKELKNHAWWQKEYNNILQTYKNWLLEIETPLDDHIRNQLEQNSSWNSINYTIYNMQYEDKFYHILSIIELYVKKYNISEDIKNDLFQLQKYYFVRYENISNYPYIINCKYDIWGFIVDNKTLLEIPTQYKLDFFEKTDISMTSFIEKYYFKRRSYYGRATITSNFKNNLRT